MSKESRMVDAVSKDVNAVRGELGEWVSRLQSIAESIDKMWAEIKKIQDSLKVKKDK